jgi:hypothetical protein
MNKSQRQLWTLETMRKEFTMSRMKSIFAALVLTAIVGVVPQAQAQTVKVVIAGSSAMWQALAVGAYNNGTCSTLLTGCTGATFHWTSAKSGATEPFLSDNRPTPANIDPGPLWVVWDSAATPNVWIYAKVDSVVGDRCYFARPACNLILPTSAPLTGANLITIWAPSVDTDLPSTIASLLNTGLSVNVAATDIRPEDAAWAAARVNSKAGGSTYAGGATDGLDGLGYNVNNAPGVPAVFPAGTTHGVGSPILSGQPGSTATANVLAFNITGKDPITNTLVPGYAVTPVGAAPMVFVTARTQATGLATVTNATELQLQQVFSGANCDATAFGVAGGTGLNIMLREPLSGTMNTTEATVFRRPTVYPGAVLGISQETGVYNTSTLTLNNPLKGQAGTCTSASGTGARYRGIGTGEVVNGVLISNNSGQFTTAQDGIAYTFFSYGNVKPLASQANFGYLTLNGVDPIFQSYGTTIDPGQPAGGQLPGAANLPAVCAGNFPCTEKQIWANGFSFPNVRNGTYRSWSLLRLVATGTASAAAQALANSGASVVVTVVPDYVPFKATTAGGISDLGLKLLRSHYAQRDGNGVRLGKTTAITNEPTENGGDMGGLIIPTTIGVTTEQQIQLIQNETPTSQGPVSRTP